MLDTLGLVLGGIDEIADLEICQNLAVLLLDLLQGLWFELRMKWIISESQASASGDALSDPQVRRLHANPKHHHAVFEYLDLSFLKMALSRTWSVIWGTNRTDSLPYFDLDEKDEVIAYCEMRFLRCKTRPRSWYLRSDDGEVWLPYWRTRSDTQDGNLPLWCESFALSLCCPYSACIMSTKDSLWWTHQYKTNMIIL